MLRPPKKPALTPLSGARQNVVDLSKAKWVAGKPLCESAPYPLCIKPVLEGICLSDWANDNAALINSWLLEYRALLFRGFNVETIAAFETFVSASSTGDRLAYVDRSTPRTTHGDGIYTSTIHPADQRIAMHNEGTYWTQWARKLYFYCDLPSAQGGATPLADVREVLRCIPAGIREVFEHKKMMLIRNYNTGFGLPWQDVFQTESAHEVEQYCTSHDIHYEWKNGDHLCTKQIRPAIRRHPDTGEDLWFNHAAFFHPSSLEPALRKTLVKEFGIGGLPYNTCYGDGTPIDDETAETIRGCYEAAMIRFPWQKGDILLLDNMTIAHGREPYQGERKVLVAMTEAVCG